MSFEKINAWILKEKELLEKLSLEISRNFSISEKLAKKLIFETHLSLDDLKNELKKENLLLKKEKFKEARLEELQFFLLKAREIIKENSKKNIENFKDYIEENIVFLHKNDILKQIFPKKVFSKIENPQNIADHILWWSMWILNSIVNIWDVIYNLGKDFLKTPKDLYAILNNSWELESFKKI